MEPALISENIDVLGFQLDVLSFHEPDGTVKKSQQLRVSVARRLQHIRYATDDVVPAGCLGKVLQKHTAGKWWERTWPPDRTTPMRRDEDLKGGDAASGFENSMAV